MFGSFSSLLLNTAIRIFYKTTIKFWCYICDFTNQEEMAWGSMWEKIKPQPQDILSSILTTVVMMSDKAFKALPTTWIGYFNWISGPQIIEYFAFKQFVISGISTTFAFNIVKIDFKILQSQMMLHYLWFVGCLLFSLYFWEFWKWFRSTILICRIK